MTVEIRPLTCEYHGYFKPSVHRPLNGRHYIAHDFRRFDEVAAEIGLSLQTAKDLAEGMNFASHSYVLLYKASSRINTDFAVSAIDVVADKVHVQFFEIVPPSFMLSSVSTPHFSSVTAFQGVDEMIKSAQIFFFHINKDHRHIVISSDTEHKDMGDLKGFELLKEYDAMMEEVKSVNDRINRLSEENKLKVAEGDIVAINEGEALIGELRQARREMTQKAIELRNQAYARRPIYRALLGNLLTAIS